MIGMPELPEITTEELRAKLERGDDFELVETLPEEKYRAAHLPGAINLPPEGARRRVSDLLPDREQEIVVYCTGPD